MIVRPAALLAAVLLTAASTCPAAVVTSHHQMTLDGQPLGYTATVAETALSGPYGKTIIGIGTATTYVREGQDAAARPLIFIFNGGPGASSSTLHLAFGPRTVSNAAPGAAQVMADNPFTLLDGADLVFIDPVGTGYSRAASGQDPSPLFGVTADARSVAAIIRSEIARLHRAGSPLYLMGESYGGARAAVILHEAKDLRFRGVILISPSLDFSGASDAPGNDLPYTLDTPTYAATAWVYGRGPKVASAADAFAAGEAFAGKDYVLALRQGDALDPATRARVAADLGPLIGVSSRTLADHDLRLDVETFRRALLPDRGLIVGRLDSRQTGPMSTFDKAKPPGDDPSMIDSREHPSPRLALDRYYRTELAFPAPADTYRTLNLEVNFRWNYKTDGLDPFYLDVAPFIGEALNADPRLKVYVAGGLFDLATPFGATTYALNHIGAAPGRVRIVPFATGHMVEDDPAAHRQLRSDIEALVHEATP